MPEGGLILLGVSESAGSVEVTGVNDPVALMGTLGQKARERIIPPIQLGAVEKVRVMLSHQAPPRFDVQPVEGADVENDIDETLLQQYLQEQIQALPPLRSLTREDLRIKTNVVDRDTGQPTIAALYALGIYPQQFLPTLSVKARVVPGSGEEAEFRVRNQP